MIIKYYKREGQYGFGGRMYPVGNEGGLIMTLTGRSTLTERDVTALELLGHKLVEVAYVKDV